MNSAWKAIFIIGLYHAAKTEAGDCTTRGKFPNTLSSDCRGYTMCLTVLNNFTRIDLTCPEYSIYSHLDSQCTNVTSYQCLPEYNCTKVGNFSNPSTNDCTSYVACVEAMGEIVTARVMECPPDTLFSPIEYDCVNKTIVKCIIAKEPPKVLEASLRNSASSKVFYTNYAFYSKIIVFLVYLFIN